MRLLPKPDFLPRLHLTERRVGIGGSGGAAARKEKLAVKLLNAELVISGHFLSLDLFCKHSKQISISRK